VTPLILVVADNFAKSCCLAFILLQYTPAWPPSLIFKITRGRLQISLSKAAGCAALG